MMKTMTDQELKEVSAETMEWNKTKPLTNQVRDPNCKITDRVLSRWFMAQAR